MKYVQEIKVEGDDIVLLAWEVGSPVHARVERRWKGAGKYVAGRTKNERGYSELILRLPERAGLNVKPGGTT